LRQPALGVYRRCPRRRLGRVREHTIVPAGLNVIVLAEMPCSKEVLNLRKGNRYRYLALVELSAIGFTGT
jgi:hypothetical protein